MGCGEPNVGAGGSVGREAGAEVHGGEEGTGSLSEGFGESTAFWSKT